MHNKNELLMPAGSLEKLKVAILYGADAVYMGTPDMSLRTKSNFTLEEVIEGVTFAHQHGKRVYLTLNLFSHNRDLDKLPEFVETIRKVQPDGVIIADPGILHYVKEHAPELAIHISTQANVCSWLSVKFWQDMGADLVVLAREASFTELKEIRQKCPDIRLEAFVHGAMCMTYSGRCLLSNYMAERGANQGNCANSCRWKYKVHMRLKDGSLHDIELTDANKDLFEFVLEEEQRPGEWLPIEEDERGSYILNSKDLCLMPRLDEYMSIGLDSLKVEGRNRSAFYVAVTARTYRKAIDDWYASPQTWRPDPYMRELLTLPNRGYSLAFHEGKLTHHAHNYEDTHTLSAWEYAGIIRHVTQDAFLVDVKNKLDMGDVLEFIPHTKRDPLLLRIYEFEDINNRRTTREEGLNAGQKPMLRIPFSLFHEEEIQTLATDFPVNTIIRKERALGQEEWARLKLDQTASLIEMGRETEPTYQNNRQALVVAIDHDTSGKTFRTPRLGVEGCCGRGCNGCLHFWHDERFAKARQLLGTKKQGVLLNNSETLDKID
ncbi:MAG: U32 family peptidase [Alphaproteobacteria bacterium]|nr:U32 family peptidase [Alphaproteobacteria bacterium]